MKRVLIFLVVVLVSVIFSTGALAETVIAKSVSSGTYEDGKFTPKGDSFQARYFVDEVLNKITMEQIIENNREGKIEEGVIYDITNVSISEGISALLVSKNKKGQKIITAVREGGLGASEILILGQTFYEFCRAENGKFYLEYGAVGRIGGANYIDSNKGK